MSAVVLARCSETTRFRGEEHAATGMKRLREQIPGHSAHTNAPGMSSIDPSSISDRREGFPARTDQQVPFSLAPAAAVVSCSHAGQCEKLKSWLTM